MEIINNSDKAVTAIDLVCGNGAVTKKGLTDEENPIVVIKPYGTTTIEMGFSEMTPNEPLVVGNTTPGPGVLSKTVRWTIFWLDEVQGRAVDITDYGEAGPEGIFFSCTKCWPEFHTPFWEDDGTTAYWFLKTYKGKYRSDVDECMAATEPTSDHRQGHTCRGGERMVG
ncbi:MAG TPA: hypothetical protein VFY67_01010, partial [Pyrinomonadaceae bacterium]|nr:hypothetical protein [Pyrinomonadaceae bacterium]